ncbi:MAG: hypothetical protein LWW94_02070 [Candidatus Desulfofervidaceae bacterium]|nr:hypothetical protein [Candidatus Desulfofervidaceae bacterium]
MKEILERIADLEGVKGVWIYEGDKCEEKLAIPLDLNTIHALKDVFSRLFATFKNSNLDELVGCISEYDYFIFKKIETKWLVVWAKKTTSFSLLKMEIEIILNDIIQKKDSLFKKLKFW